MHTTSTSRSRAEDNTDVDAIRVWALTKRFGRVTAVKDASFEVKAGDVFGLLGPNGAGKTTIIRMLVGLMKPDSGNAHIFGFDPTTNRREVLQRTSSILESPALYPRLSGYDNLRAMALVVGVHDPKKLFDVLSTMGLIDRAKDKFEAYSLGMKQRLCIAAALLTDPQLIILDEPTNGLDPAGMRDIRELIRDLTREGRTVFLSSHLLSEVQQVCNRVAILQRGLVIAQGEVATLLAGRGTVLIRVPPADHEKASAILKDHGWAGRVRLNTDHLIVDSASGQGAEINRALAAQGIYASEITPQSQSLEQYYLTQTGAASSTDDADKAIGEFEQPPTAQSASAGGSR